MKCLVQVSSSLVLAASFPMSHCLGPICLSRMIQGAKPAKESFVMVRFQRSVSDLLQSVFCSFPNSFPKVSVVYKHGSQTEKGQQCPKVFFWRQDERPSLLAIVMHNFLGPRHGEGLKKC